MEQWHTCPVCGLTDVVALYVVNGYDIARCEGCRLVFVRQRLTADELSRYYASGGDVVYSDPENVANLNFYFLKLRSLIEEQLPTGGRRLLDVGCSAGNFLDVMAGWDVYGVEMDPSAAGRAQERYGNRVHHGTLDDLPQPTRQFDVVTLLDTFDHVVDPLTTLARCHALLRPGGMLVIKVHDISCLYARLAGKRFYAIIPPSHLFYYEEASLRFVLSRAGFVPQSARHIGHRLFLKTIPYRLARSRTSGVFFRLYQVLDRLRLGNLAVPKNLHDIITVTALRGG